MNRQEKDNLIKSAMNLRAILHKLAHSSDSEDALVMVGGLISDLDAIKVAQNEENNVSTMKIDLDTGGLQLEFNGLVSAISDLDASLAMSREYWKSQIGAPVSVEMIQGEAVALPLLDPLESAIQSTVTMIRDELQMAVEPGDKFPSGAYARLDDHLDRLLAMQLEKLGGKSADARKAGERTSGESGKPEQAKLKVVSEEDGRGFHLLLDDGRVLPISVNAVVGVSGVQTVCAEIEVDGVNIAWGGA